MRVTEYDHKKKLREEFVEQVRLAGDPPASLLADKGMVVVDYAEVERRTLIREALASREAVRIIRAAEEVLAAGDPRIPPMQRMSEAVAPPLIKFHQNRHERRANNARLRRQRRRDSR